MLLNAKINRYQKNAAQISMHWYYPTGQTKERKSLADGEDQEC